MAAKSGDVRGRIVAEAMFGPYRLDGLIGRGGMGEVWRAVDTSHDDRVVALKLLGAWLGGDPDFARRFRRESALAAKLTSPNIIPIHSYGEIDGRLYIAMPLIDGSDLGSLIKREGPPVPAQAVSIIEQVADALDTANRAGMVHRDVKPSNILITGRDFAYLIDFGIARAVDGTKISLSGAVIGTPAYMAPERFDGDGDHRSDIYALGCVLYEALTGHPPFEASSLWAYMKAHHETPPPPPRPSALRPGLPSALDDVIASGMAKDPDDRYASAGGLAAAARDALAPAPAAAPTDAPPRAAKPAFDVSRMNRPMLDHRQIFEGLFFGPPRHSTAASTSRRGPNAGPSTPPTPGPQPRARPPEPRRQRGTRWAITMIILMGLILTVLGYVLGIYLLTTLGATLLVIGAVVLIDRADRAVARRRSSNEVFSARSD